MMKRLFTSLIFSLAALSLTAQDVEYSVSGEVFNDTEWVYLYKVRFSEVEVLDSMEVVDGHFNVQGVAPKDELLSVGNQDVYLPFVNDGVPIRMVIDGPASEGRIITAPFLFVEASEQNMKLCAIDTTITNISRSLEDMDVVDEATFEQAMTTVIYRELNVLLENKETMAPLIYLRDVIDEVDYESLAPLMDSTTVYYHHPAMAEIIEYYQTKGKTRLGITYHDALLGDLYGRNHRLSEYCGRGNYVLLDFWASWCTPCLREMPNLINLYRKYRGKKNFEIIGISLDNSSRSWTAAVQRLGLQWPQLSDLKVREGEAAQAYGIVNIPSNVLLDPDGIIIATNLMGENLARFLENILE